MDGARRGIRRINATIIQLMVQLSIDQPKIIDYDLRGQGIRGEIRSASGGFPSYFPCSRGSHAHVRKH